MGLPGVSEGFDDLTLNSMQLTSVNALNAPSNGVLQVRTSAGQVFLETTPIAQLISPPVTYQQFEIVIVDNRLSVQNGTVIWAKHNFGKDEQGNPTVTCSSQTLITTFAPYTGSAATNGFGTNNNFMNEDGYVTLSS